MGLTRRWLFYTLILVYWFTLYTLTLNQGAIKLVKDHFFSFRWLFYTLILVYGFQCLWRKPWFWNIRHCWYDYPYHQVKDFSLSPIHQHNGFLKSFSQFKKKSFHQRKSITCSLRLTRMCGFTTWWSSHFIGLSQ